MDEYTWDEARALICNRFNDVDPDPEGWWHSHNEETYISLFNQAIGFGLTPSEAVHLLAGAFGAAADEYGA